jgi:DNA-binding NtrC family response regulator
MNAVGHVLVVSKDQMLLQTRQLILGAFFQVNGAGRVQEVESLLSRQAFDLIILCYSISDDERSHILNLVQGRTPRPRILNLKANGFETAPIEADQELTMEGGPYGLLKKTAQMLGVDLRAKPPTVRSRTTTVA